MGTYNRQPARPTHLHSAQVGNAPRRSIARVQGTTPEPVHLTGLASSCGGISISQATWALIVNGSPVDRKDLSSAGMGIKSKNWNVLKRNALGSETQLCFPGLSGDVRNVKVTGYRSLARPLILCKLTFTGCKVKR
jgi:hypothetical protein